MPDILLIGCGELGSRHLQAVAALPFIQKVVAVDPSAKALETGRQRVLGLPDRNPAIEWQWASSLDGIRTGFDLCIVATQAKGRAALVRQVAETIGIGRFLLEKIVTPSVAEYQSLLRLAKGRALKIWVNCKTRAYPVHQYIKSRLRPEEPLLFSSLGGNHGLANNGVHTADLFAFYDDAETIKRIAAEIDPDLHPSKRGETIFDLSGTLVGRSEKGSLLTLAYAGNHTVFDTIQIVTKSRRFIVDHFQRWAVESGEEDGGAWRPIPVEGNLMVSHMTKAFVTDIFEKGDCELPTLEECFPAHQFILESLQPHFNRLLGKELDCCPVT